MPTDQGGRTIARWREDTEREQDAIARSSLLPWQLSFAEWIANQHYSPKVVAQAAKASEIASAALGSPVDIAPDDVRALRQRPNFREAVKRFRDESLNRARKTMEAHLSHYATAHINALKIAEEKQDYRAMAQISEPILERVWPKRGDTAGTAVQVNITLSPKQQEILDSVAEADVEVLDAEVIEDDESSLDG